MTDEVKFTDAQWDELARAAEAFATVLDDQQVLLTYVLSTNWAGQCAEGTGLMDNLRSVLHGGTNSFVNSIASEASYLRSLAKVCGDAKHSFNAAEAENAGVFGS